MLKATVFIIGKKLETVFHSTRKDKLWYIYFKGIPGNGKNDWTSYTF